VLLKFFVTLSVVM